jgi:hypothetical protein
VTQEVADAGDGLDRELVTMLGHEARDGVERVEQEVRLRLMPQRIESRLRELASELRRRRALRGQSFVGFQHAAGHHTMQ